ncbi:plasma membrane localization protein [Coemansia biformis]|uniref:Guanine nucleotide-binding protein subunit gamma n=1 Tax=Coemansia biformis TaxID=1286918 RepID=A0A9W8CX25_9FUNG|nr:plasma membrane localization protein [Coemansia biformis]
MSEHKLRKIVELNGRLKEQLELPRIPVSQASDSLIAYMSNTKDYLLPSVWGPPPHDPFASPTSGGCGCSVMHYVKHASLVERCFPAERAGDAAPNSNELSYLVYYAQSKPAKLTKVGAHLSRRIAKDAQRHRRADVLVGLLVFDALLDACGRDLNFFAGDVLGSIDAALATGDPELIPAATRTFARFCRCHSGAILAIDTALCSLYARLARTFAAYTQPGADAVRAGLGLCALQAIAESRATYASDYGDELPLVVGAVIARIAAAPASASAPGPEPGLEPAALSVAEEQVAAIITQAGAVPPTDAQLGDWAWRCIETLVRRSHGQHSRVIVAEIFRQLDHGLAWRPVSLCVRIVATAVAQLQPHDQNMVIVETLAFLTNGAFSSPLYLRTLSHDALPPPDALPSSDGEREREPSAAARRRTCLIRILERLFCKPHVLVGVSVMEALSVLVAVLLESAAGESPARPDQAMFAAALRAASGPDDGASPGGEPPADGMTDDYHLLAAISGLARHQYYAGQLPDMAGFLVSQMTLGAERGAERRATRRLVWQLQALYAVLRASQAGPPAAGTLPLDTLAPLFTLLLHENPDCRLMAADCIAEALRRAQPAVSRTDLVRAIYGKLGAVLRDTHESPMARQPAGYAGAASILCALHGVLEPAGPAHTLALVRDFAPERATGAWATFLATVWADAARRRRNSSLGSLVTAVAADARDQGLWEDAIEGAAQRRVRVAEIGSQPTAAGHRPSAAAAVDTLVERLGSGSIAELLGLEAAAPTSLDADAAAMDRVLGDAGGPGIDAVSPPTAADQVKDTRARVSVDWEVQVQRDSGAAAHVSVDRLRAALRSGLVVHAGVRSPAAAAAASPSAGHSRDVLGTVAQNGMTSDSDSCGDVGALGSGGEGVWPRHRSPGALHPPVPDEVRALLDSIGGDGSGGSTGPAPRSEGAHSSSPRVDVQVGPSTAM